MADSSSNKVLGIEAEKYPQIAYILILIASGYGVLTNLTGLVGMYLPGGMITGLLGLVGLALTVTGWLVFKDKFSEVAISHFKYLVIIFAVFFVIYVVIVNLLIGLGPVGAFIITAISIIQFALLFAGFKNLKRGVAASKDTIMGTLKSGFKN